MKIFKLTMCVAACLFAATAWAQQAAPGLPVEEVPGVPAQVIKAAAEGSPAINLRYQGGKAGGGSEGSIQIGNDETKTINTQIEAPVEPGANTIIPIAAMHLNRLVTPFPSPQVDTASNAEFQVKGSVIYVAPQGTSPITMFVSDKASPLLAMSLTLVPKTMAPREVRLVFKGAGGSTMAAISPYDANEWEKRDSYLDTLKFTMETLAKGTLPGGYGLRAYSASTDPHIGCGMGGIKIEPAQTLEGHNLQIVVGLVTNISGEPLIFDEASCYNEMILAAAAWPSVRLGPGEKTELYLVHRRPSPEELAAQRPSLLSPAGQTFIHGSPSAFTKGKGGKAQ